MLIFVLENKETPESMFGTNVAKLIEIKKQYDPYNIFNKLNPL